MGALARVRKALTALVTFAAAVVAAGVLQGQAEVYVELVIGLLGTFGVYATPNAESDVEQRIRDLETSVPGLPGLIAEAVAAALKQFSRPTPSGVRVVPPIEAPPDPVEAVKAAEAALAHAQTVLRDSRGRFVRRTP
jgi:hypothetical protein